MYGQTSIFAVVVTAIAVLATFSSVEAGPGSISNYRPSSPSPINTCSLPPSRGPCKALFRRWFYNTKSGKCERFNYGGCRGNANNFRTLADCLNRCLLQCPLDTPIVNCFVDPCRVTKCPAHPKARCRSDFCGSCNARFFNPDGCEVTATCNACKLPKVVGPCEAAIKRYFFNTTSKKCEQFIFGGCKGNANNFKDLPSCLRTCDPKVLQCPPNKPIATCKADPCQVTTCPENPSATCISDFCGGCNARFFDKKGCEVTSTCNTCKLPKVVGPCKAAIRRYFFNSASRKCEQFIYGGCKGNANNFKNLASCLNTCDPSVLQCPPNKPVVNCFADPCRVTTCPRHPSATCISDFCGGCNARYFDKNGCEVTSTCKCPPKCSRKFCKSNQYAACTNPGPREIPGCTGKCQTTLCKACYSSQKPLRRPKCVQCYGKHTGLKLRQCLRIWARCVNTKYNYYYRYRGSKGSSSTFRCWNAPCPFKG